MTGDAVEALDAAMRGVGTGVDTSAHVDVAERSAIAGSATLCDTSDDVGR
jgi:hypothetical protein